MYLVCGIHGSGKTVYCHSMEKKLGIPCFSASKLIGKTICINQVKTKNIDRIDERQQVLISETKKLEAQYGEFILDGHLCLINDNGNIERIPQEVFLSMHISEIRVLRTDEGKIQKRMLERDGINWDLEYIKSFQSEEINYARELSVLCNTKLEIVDTSQEDNIILPISPVFANKIVNGEKKYEFRKKIAKKDVNKIYIYATSPVKKIIGEVEVLSKISMDKEELWELSYNEAGVTKEFYLKYFNENKEANAYLLGKVEKYYEGISLADIGVSYVPQSFVYIGEI